MRLAWRLSVRSLRAAGGRSLLVVLLLAIPLSLSLAGLTLRQSSQMPIDTRVGAIMGQASEVLLSQRLTGKPSAESITRGQEDVSQLLGRTVPLVPEVGGDVPLRVSDREVDTYLYGLANDPIHDGRFHVLAGGWPEDARSVALSESAATLARASVGDTVTLGDGQGTEAHVAGIVAIATDRERRFMVAEPEFALDLVPISSEAGVDTGRSGTLIWYPRHPLSTQDRSLLAASGQWRVKTRSFNEQQQQADHEGGGTGPDEVKTLIIGVFLLLIAEMALLVFAVYAVTLAALRREFALLAVIGSSPAQ